MRIFSLEAVLIVMWVSAALGIGYWCFSIWRAKGRSPWRGFVLGFLLSFVETPIAGLVVVGVSYALGDRTRGPTPRSNVVVGILIAVAALAAFAILFQAVATLHG